MTEGPDVWPEVEESLIAYLRAPDAERPARLSAMLARFPEHRGEIQRLVADDPQQQATRVAAPADAGTAPRHAATPALGDVLGELEIRGTLGRGGMGVVYEAFDRTLHRRVALKVLGNAAQHPDGVRRFLREARAAAQLEHPNIVRVHRVGEANGVPFLAMELVEGVALDAAVAELRRRGIREPTARDLAAALRCELAPAPALGSYEAAVLALLAPIADALHSAHTAGIVHRDVKPSNVMVRRDGTPVLLDFGLASLETATRMTVSGEFLGSPVYASPEQASVGRHPVDHRTDVYSLCATLYELLTLAPPFSGTSPAQILRRVELGPIPAPRAVRPRLSRDVDLVCTTGLAKEAQHRYQTARALASDMRRIVEGRGVTVRRVSAWARFYRWSRLHPGRLAAGVVSLVAVLAVGLAVTSAVAAREAAAGERAIRGAYASQSFDAGRLAVQNGQFDQALAAVDSARAAEFPDLVSLQLLRVEALEGAQRFAEASAALVAPVLDVSREHPSWARVVLLRADRLANRFSDPFDRLDDVRAALEAGGLPRGDEAFARGLLAADYASAREHLVRALTEDPGHRRATLYLAWLEALSSDLAVARQRLRELELRFPEDPNILVLSLLLGVREHGIAPRQAEDDAPRDSRGVWLEAVVPAALDLVRTAVDGWAEMMFAMRRGGSDAEAMVGFGRFLLRAFPPARVLARAALELRAGPLVSGIAIHPLVVASWKPLVGSGLRAILRAGAGLGPPPPLFLEQLDRSVAISGDGLLHLVRGLLRVRSDPHAALADLQAAAVRPTPFPVRRVALRLTLALPGPDAAGLAARVEELVRDAAVQALDFEIAAGTARDAQDVPLEREVVARWRRLFPHDMTGLRWAVERAAADGEFQRALDLCEQATPQARRDWADEWKPRLRAELDEK